MIQIYWFSGSAPAWRVLLALEAKGLPYRSKQISAMAGDHMKPEFLAMNRRHKVPVLVDGDLVMYRSLAILAYLEEKYPETALMPERPEDRGRVWRFLMDFEANAYPTIVGGYAIPVFFNKIEGNEDGFKDSYNVLLEELGVIEAQLAGRDWLVGDRMTMADIAFYPVFAVICRVATKPAVADVLGAAPDFANDFPAIEAWRARMAALPYHDRTWPPGWTD